MQTGKNPVALPANMVMIDMKHPEGQRASTSASGADAMNEEHRHSGCRGRDGPGVKETQAAFPPSGGLTDRP